MPEFYCIITDIGLSKLASAKMTGQDVILTKMAVGDSNGAYYDPLSSQTELLNEKHKFDINRIYIDHTNSKQLLVEASITDVVGGFFIREIGVFDDQGDLFAIGKYPVTYKPTSESGSGKDLYIRMALLFSNTPNISLYINPHSAVASIEAVETMLAKLEHNELQSIQGGGSGEKYHLGLSQHKTVKSLDGLKSSDNSGKAVAINGSGDGFCIAPPDELFQNMIEIFEPIVAIEENHSIYKMIVENIAPEDEENGSENDVVNFAFDTSEIQNVDKIVTFELFLDIKALKTIIFPDNVKWLNDTAPEIEVDKKYLFAFRSFDNGGNWIANVQGWWQ